MAYLANSCTIPGIASATRSQRYREFLKKLRAARRAAGLTQVEVASIAFTQEPDP